MGALFIIAAVHYLLTKPAFLQGDGYNDTWNDIGNLV